MYSLEDLDAELALTHRIGKEADRITEQSRNGVQREFVSDVIARAVVNILNDQLRTGNGLSRNWTKTVINLALVIAVENQTPNIRAAAYHELLIQIDDFREQRSTTIEEARGAGAVAEMIRNYRST